MKGPGTRGWGLGRGLSAIALTLLASGPAKAGHDRNTVGAPVVSGLSRTISPSVVSGFSRTISPSVVSGFSRTNTFPVVSGFSRTNTFPVVSGFSRTADDAAVRRQLAGEWSLVKYEIFDENGQTRPGNYDIGRINYGDREMSAHLMRSGRPKESPTSEAARAAAYQGYLGYFGPYTVDAEKQIVVHHVAGSSLPNWFGTDQVRHYAFSSDGKQLTLSLKSGDRITQTLTWERTRP